MGRWLTSANGYLRVFQNHLFEDMINLDSLVTIVNFIVNVYAPFWFQIHLNPRLPCGPDNSLFARDLLLGHEDEEMFQHVLPYFQSHALTWLCPQNVCISVYSEYQSMMFEGFEPYTLMLKTFCGPADHLCKAFFIIESQFAPYISHGDNKYWNSVDNHNRSCEQLIGVMKDINGNRKVMDKENNLAVSDERVRNRMCLHDLKEFS